MLEWQSFSRSLDTFVLLPTWMRSAALVLTPAAELVPLALLVVRRAVAANVASIVLIVSFSLIVYWHWVRNVQPVCGCLGLWADYVRQEGSSRYLLIRNAVIVSFSVFSIALTLVSRRGSAKVEPGPIP